MTVTMSTGTPLVTLGASAMDRYTSVYPLIGSFISLSCGDHLLEGVLTKVIRPAATSESGPLVVIDTGVELIAGPLLAGDRLLHP